MLIGSRIGLRSAGLRAWASSIMDGSWVVAVVKPFTVAHASSAYCQVSVAVRLAESWTTKPSPSLLTETDSPVRASVGSNLPGA